MAKEIKSLEELTGADIQRKIAKEFKAGRKAALEAPKSYRRDETEDKIKASFDSPLVSAYWMGVYWSLTHKEDGEKI
jgi:hypothetical protein